MVGEVVIEDLLELVDAQERPQDASVDLEEKILTSKLAQEEDKAKAKEKILEPTQVPCKIIEVQ